MEQIFELLLRNGLRPLRFIPELDGVELHASRSEIAVLLVLSLRGARPMTELAKELGAPLSTMTSLTKRLVQKGFIERKKSPEDQRMILVELTARGRELVMRIQARVERVFSRVQAAFTAEELTQLLSLAMKLIRVFQQESGEGSDSFKSGGGLRTIKIED